MHILALFEGVQLHGACADNLENDGHSACCGIIMGNRQGDALGILLGADDDELARFRLFGNQRCFNDHFGHCGVQFPLFNDLEHLF